MNSIIALVYLSVAVILIVFGVKQIKNRKNLRKINQKFLKENYNPLLYNIALNNAKKDNEMLKSANSKKYEENKKKLSNLN